MFGLSMVAAALDQLAPDKRVGITFALVVGDVGHITERVELGQTCMDCQQQ